MADKDVTDTLSRRQMPLHIPDYCCHFRDIADYRLPRLAGMLYDITPLPLWLSLLLLPTDTPLIISHATPQGYADTAASADYADVDYAIAAATAFFSH